MSLRKNCYHIVKRLHVTEKSKVLESLHTNTSNNSVRRCESPKYVFIVDKKANKQEIALAVEEIYSDKNVKVSKVNTINVKPKERTVRGRRGFTVGFKKAVVTLEPGHKIEE